MQVNAVLFDLDGTLLDTAPDLGNALNILLTRYHQPPQSLAAIRTVASNGSLGLLKLGFGMDDLHPDYPKFRDELLQTYFNNLAAETRLFQGMETVLTTLENNNIAWGIVTNKPGWLTEPLLQQLNLDKRAQCIVSGDTLAVRKPHPEPLWHACEIIKITPQETIYIGDCERDIEAGRRAGMRTLIAKYGYIALEDTPETWQADGMLNHPEEILEWL